VVGGGGGGGGGVWVCMCACVCVCIYISNRSREFMGWDWTTDASNLHTSKVLGPDPVLMLDLHRDTMHKTVRVY